MTDRDNADYWDKHRDTIRAMFHPVTEAVTDEARIEPGQKVLDVATGSGEPALSIAEVVGPAGLVVGIDPLSEMIASAQRTASEAHLDSVRFQVGSVEHLPFEDDYFDSVVSRFGVMFFPSPVDGVRELLRVLKPGHPLVFSAWCHIERNPFHYVMASVVDRYFPPPPASPDSPGPFRYADSGKLLNVLNQAGTADTRERLRSFKIEIPFTGEDFWTLRMDMAEKLRGKIASLPAAKAAEIKQEVFQNLIPYAKGDGLSFPGEVLIVSGTKRVQESD